jgi:hypothetical protein
MGIVRKLMLASLLALSLTACETANTVAMKIGKEPDGALNLRTLETRRYDTLDEGALLVASTQTLQDLGFTISESASKVGILVASKQRDAKETGQIAGAVIVGILFGANAMVWDEDQTINVTLVTSPIANSKQVDVRVAFDRIVRNNRQGYRAELLMDPKLYQEFFDKLSQGVQLQGQQV